MAADQISVCGYLPTIRHTNLQRHNQQLFEMLGHFQGSCGPVARDVDFSLGPNSQQAVVTVRQMDLLDR
jgi:hypothetical protein